MAIINPSWYLCVLFAVALVVSSAITIAPGDCAWMRLERGMWLGLSVTFAACAVVFWRFRACRITRLLRLFQCIAVVATLVVLMMLRG
jgi:hypothetical protein